MVPVARRAVPRTRGTVRPITASWLCSSPVIRVSVHAAWTLLPSSASAPAELPLRICVPMLAPSSTARTSTETARRPRPASPSGASPPSRRPELAAHGAATRFTPVLDLPIRTRPGHGQAVRGAARLFAAMGTVRLAHAWLGLRVAGRPAVPARRRRAGSPVPHREKAGSVRTNSRPKTLDDDATSTPWVTEKLMRRSQSLLNFAIPSPSSYIIGRFLSASDSG